MNSKFKKILIFVMVVCLTVISFAIYKHVEEASLDDSKETEIIESEPIVVSKVEESVEENIEPQKAITIVSLGEFKLTAYCPCEECCGVWAVGRPNGVVYGAFGEPLTANYSIAVDPNVIPYGTELIINGHTYKAQDCGGAIDGREIDIYFDNHEEALEFGVQYAKVLAPADANIVLPEIEEEPVKKPVKEPAKEPVKDNTDTDEDVETDTESTEKENEDGWVSLGTFKITFYCSCKKCNGKWYGYPTASGTDYVEGRTIAVDKSVISLGTSVKIDGWGDSYIAEDTGVKGNHIDIFIDDHDKCYQYGVQKKEVWVKK